MADTPLPTAVGRLTTLDMQPADVEAVKSLLRGHSVIDWHKLAMNSHEEVDRFLTLNEFNPRQQSDMDVLEEVRSDAVDYLTRVFHATIPEDIAVGVPARDLFLVASRHSPQQRWACVVLKVMHIIHHINGRASLLKLSVSDELIFRQVELKVLGVVDALKAAGLPIAEFEWSRKPRDSQITKLLAKRSTLAVDIYDKIRFRLIVPTEADLLPTLVELSRKLVPFNYVVPGESTNQLVDLKSALLNGEGPSAVPRVAEWDESGVHPVTNEFSGPEYRIINFVADLPLRIDHLLGSSAAEFYPIIFVLTEFQMADRATAIRNETGACSHEAYKARQHQKVRQRLFRGDV